MGDVNDFSVDPPDAAGSMPTSRVLDILAGTAAGFEGGPVLRNVMELVPQAERITSWCAAQHAQHAQHEVCHCAAPCAPRNALNERAVGRGGGPRALHSRVPTCTHVCMQQRCMQRYV